MQPGGSTSRSLIATFIYLQRNSAPGEDPATVDMSGRDISIVVDLKAGTSAATIWSNDLTAEYVHENSAYST